MIEMEPDSPATRWDIVSYCPNCAEIAAARIGICPKCKHEMTRRQVTGCVDMMDRQGVPVMIIDKAELINRFIPKATVDRITDEQLVKIARIVEVSINHTIPDIIPRSVRRALKG